MKPRKVVASQAGRPSAANDCRRSSRTAPAFPANHRRFAIERLRWLLPAIPTLLVLLVLVFAGLRSLPAGPSARDNATPEILANLNHLPDLGPDEFSSEVGRRLAGTIFAPARGCGQDSPERGRSSAAARKTSSISNRAAGSRSSSPKVACNWRIRYRTVCG